MKSKSPECSSQATTGPVISRSLSAAKVNSADQQLPECAGFRFGCGDTNLFLQNARKYGA